MKEVKLKNHTVKIKENDELTYGDIEEIQALLTSEVQMQGGEMSGVSGEGLKKYNHKIAELAITEIVNQDGNYETFTVDWLQNLPAKDGMKLIEELQEQTKLEDKKKAAQK